MQSDRQTNPLLNESLEQSFSRSLQRIARLSDVYKVILFGSYAKGTATQESDVDLAVFFRSDKASLLDEYRALVRIFSAFDVEIQVQAFHAYELDHPCGIIEEIVTYGIEMPVPAKKENGMQWMASLSIARTSSV